jgi:hypothetical protein
VGIFLYCFLGTFYKVFSRDFSLGSPGEITLKRLPLFTPSPKPSFCSKNPYFKIANKRTVVFLFKMATAITFFHCIGKFSCDRLSSKIYLMFIHSSSLRVLCFHGGRHYLDNSQLAAACYRSFLYSDRLEGLK